jgi:hypothetical protein
VPETLKGRQRYTLYLDALVAGSRYRGDFEERLKNVLKEIRTRGVILYDETIRPSSWPTSSTSRVLLHAPRTGWTVAPTWPLQTVEPAPRRLRPFPRP